MVKYCVLVLLLLYCLSLTSWRHYLGSFRPYYLFLELQKALSVTRTMGWRMVIMLTFCIFVGAFSVHRGPSGIWRRMEMERKQWGKRRFDFGFFLEVGKQQHWRHKKTLKNLLRKKESVIISCPFVSACSLSLESDDILVFAILLTNKIHA